MDYPPEYGYPSRHTFVVKVRSDADPDALAGRLENLATGKQLDFASARELLDSIAAVLGARAAERPAGQP
jgi:hypothetical protein